jgi:flagellar hook assembly protein FlgD
VQIKIYNLLGKLIDLLVDEQKTAGEYSFTWDGRDAQGKKLAGGIYFYRLTAGGQVFTKKMLYVQ